MKSFLGRKERYIPLGRKFEGFQLTFFRRRGGRCWALSSLLKGGEFCEHLSKLHRREEEKPRYLLREGGDGISDRAPALMASSISSSRRGEGKGEDRILYFICGIDQRKKWNEKKSITLFSLVRRGRGKKKKAAGLASDLMGGWTAQKENLQATSVISHGEGRDSPLSASSAAERRRSRKRRTSLHLLGRGEMSSQQ